MPYSIVLDIGGSHIAAGLVDIKKGNEVVNFFQQPLNKNVSAEQFVGKILGSILAISKNLTSFKEVNGIGISMPGPFDYAKGVCKIEGVNKFDSVFGLDMKTTL